MRRCSSSRLGDGRASTSWILSDRRRGPRGTGSILTGRSGSSELPRLLDRARGAGGGTASERAIRSSSREPSFPSRVRDALCLRGNRALRASLATGSARRLLLEEPGRSGVRPRPAGSLRALARAAPRAGGRRRSWGAPPQACPGAINDHCGRAGLRFWPRGRPVVPAPVAALLLGRAGDLEAAETAEAIRQGGSRPRPRRPGSGGPECSGTSRPVPRAPPMRQPGSGRRRRDVGHARRHRGASGARRRRDRTVIASGSDARLPARLPPGGDARLPVSYLQARPALPRSSVLAVEPAGALALRLLASRTPLPRSPSRSHRTPRPLYRRAQPFLKFEGAGRLVAATTLAAQRGASPRSSSGVSNAVQPRLRGSAAPLGARGGGRPAPWLRTRAVLRGGCPASSRRPSPAGHFVFALIRSPGRGSRESAKARIGSHRGLLLLATTPPLRRGPGFLLAHRPLSVCARAAAFASRLGRRWRFVCAVRSPLLFRARRPVRETGGSSVEAPRRGAVRATPSSFCPRARPALPIDGGGAFLAAPRISRQVVRGSSRLKPRSPGVRRLDVASLFPPSPSGPRTPGLVAVLREIPTGVFTHGDGDDDGCDPVSPGPHATARPPLPALCGPSRTGRAPRGRAATLRRPVVLGGRRFEEGSDSTTRIGRAPPRFRRGKKTGPPDRGSPGVPGRAGEPPPGSGRRSTRRRPQGRLLPRQPDLCRAADFVSAHAPRAALLQAAAATEFHQYPPRQRSRRLSRPGRAGLPTESSLRCRRSALPTSGAPHRPAARAGHAATRGPAHPAVSGPPPSGKSDGLAAAIAIASSTGTCVSADAFASSTAGSTSERAAPPRAAGHAIPRHLIPDAADPVEFRAPGRALGRSGAREGLDRRDQRALLPSSRRGSHFYVLGAVAGLRRR